MLVYDILIITSIIFVLWSLKKDGKYSGAMLIILGFMAIMIVALRDKYTGSDTITYFNYFLYPHWGYGEYGEFKYMETGYKIFSSIIRFVWSNGYFFLFTCAITSMYPIYYLIYKKSEYKTFSAFLFITVGTTTIMYILFFSMIRQCLALSFFIWAVYFFDKNNLRINWKVVSLAILMVSMHVSSAICLPVFLLSSKVNFTRKYILAIIPLSIAFGMGLQKYAPSLQLLGAYFDRRYYFNMISENEYSLMAVLPLSLICFCIYLFADSDFTKSIYVKIFTVGVILNNVVVLMGNSDRITLFFIIFVIIVLPNFIRIKDISSKIRYPLLAVSLIYFTYKYYKVLELSTHELYTNLVPYKSFLFN